MNAIALGTLLVSLLNAAPSEEDLGDVGESCRSRADCRSGLKCLANVCAQASREGMACGATRECGGGGLRCLEHVCKQPTAAAVPALAPVVASAATYVPPPPPEWNVPAPPQYAAAAPVQYAAAAPTFSGPPSAAFGQTATVSESVRHEASALEGTHGYVGGTIGIGPGSVSGGNVTGGNLAVPLAVQGGVWFGRFDLQFELAPFTDLAVGGNVLPTLALTAKPGFLVVMHERGDFAVGWMFRLGLGGGLTAGRLAAYPVVRVNAQLIGIGIRTGRLHMEFGLPFDALLGPLSEVRLPLTFSMTCVF